jgi:hypothetical protein
MRHILHSGLRSILQHKNKSSFQKQRCKFHVRDSTTENHIESNLMLSIPEV